MREVLRELVAECGDALARWCDDPWECLDHLNDLWAYAVGLSESENTAPDVFRQGWMRLTLPADDDTNKWRWAVDPLWEIVQSAKFGDSPPVALKRSKRVVHDLDQVDAELYGLFKLRTVIRGEYLTHTTTLSQELHAFHDRMEELDEEKDRDFAESVREKARMLGKPVPMRPAGILPTRRS